MAAVSFFVFFLLFLVVLLCSMEVESKDLSNCKRFQCGKFGEMKFPYISTDMPVTCGLYRMNCSGKFQKIQLEEGGKWYKIENMHQSKTIIITDLELQENLSSDDCDDFSDSSLPSSNWLSIKDSLTLFRCNQNHTISDLPVLNCKGYSFYYSLSNENKTNYSQRIPPGCLATRLPANKMPRDNQTNSIINATFSVEIKVPPRCYGCHYHGGICSPNVDGGVECDGEKKEDTHLPLKLGLGIGCVLLIMASFMLLIIQCHGRRGTFLSRNNSTDLHSKSDIEGDDVYFKVPIFSYKELLEATNDFSSGNLLGDGGFGTVYYGKLRDGRDIAVKLMYEHNCRRVEQFMNEIEILTRLQHRNLVSLYGCTSRRNRELLLVYEFVPHGTVADNLHGKLAKPGSLPWPIRMSIAVETASALTYLHASDVIHRDVKTNNILLDRNFSVKVADFGLSRLCPTDVTHVSTAPQGTPGYVDPEYHQCYHLTDKSDVYSFGVVLVELISSMPAVDTNRRKNEIVLSNLAINKIQKRELHELIDPNLGYETDEEVRNMTRLVAELAFQCLQQDKEMRPTMDEVLQELKRIQNGEFKLRDQEENHNDSELMKESQPPPSPRNCDEATLLKTIRFPSSPKSVAAKWVSRSTTSNTNG